MFRILSPRILVQLCAEQFLHTSFISTESSTATSTTTALTTTTPATLSWCTLLSLSYIGSSSSWLDTLLTGKRLVDGLDRDRSFRTIGILVRVVAFV